MLTIHAAIIMTGLHTTQGQKLRVVSFILIIANNVYVQNNNYLISAQRLSYYHYNSMVIGLFIAVFKSHDS
jgi:hypothetical protein